MCRHFVQTLMETLAEKLRADREKEAPVKNDYTALLKAIFGEKNLDSSLNDNDRLAEAVAQLLPTISEIRVYCLEERYFHGKPLEQLAEEFRRNLDMAEFKDKLIQDVVQSIEYEFMKKIHIIFYRMEKNSFRELEYCDGMRSDDLPKNDINFTSDADKSIVHILRDTVGMLKSISSCYKDIFERYFLKGETKEELAQWLSENMESYVQEKCSEGLRQLRHPSRIKQLKKFIKEDSNS
ncbi:MAG: hypothetical protein HDT44_05860 [Ruminococcaceae bacterium]|nr:hypothetical protein [Oscillospiraceae bacterium]